MSGCYSSARWEMESLLIHYCVVFSIERSIVSQSQKRQKRILIVCGVNLNINEQKYTKKKVIFLSQLLCHLLNLYCQIKFLNINQHQSIKQMQNPKNKCYQEDLIKTSVFKPLYNQSSTPKFQFEKISQIDDLLNKNDQIYKNLRMKLQQISQAERNITNNINAIRPIYYSSRQKENSLHMMYDRFLFDSNEEEKTIVFDNYESSPIQSERPTNLFNMKRKMEEKGVMMKEIIKNQQVINVQGEKVSQLSESQQHKRTNTNEKNSLVESTSAKQPLSHLSLSSPPHQGKASLSRLSSANNKLTSSHLRISQSATIDPEKQTFCFLNRSYEPHVDSMVRMEFVDLDQRKKEIEKVYEQLRKQEEEIERAYKEYKSGFADMGKVAETKANKLKENIMKSPPKKSSPIRNFTKGKKQQSSELNNSKSSVVLKSQDLKEQMKSSISAGNFNRGNGLTKIPESHKKIEFSPIKSSVIEYCTQQLQTIDIPEKPQPMTARSHIFVPFNKLYKSPIIQMKNKNILVLARQSKLASQKTAQTKILDGKKYKFPQNIETDEQQLIRNIMIQKHNIIAIVGGLTTLKKKLHMAIIAHSFDKIIKIISSKEYNCLTLSLSYQELIEKHENSSQRINNSIDINEETQMRIVIMQAQKIIEQIYDVIKRPHASMQSSNIAKNINPSTKEKPKVVRFTKLSLLSGKQCVWTCSILSANQFTFDFLKNLEVKDIIWSINPLIKNYDEVSKTLNESTKYIESRIQC